MQTGRKRFQCVEWAWETSPSSPRCSEKRRPLIRLDTLPELAVHTGVGRAMKTSSHDRAAGKAKEITGKVKETAGRSLKNPRLQDEGTAQRVEGTAQRKVGEIKKVFGK